MQAYGWSLPAASANKTSSSVASTPTSDDSSSSGRAANVPVPVPVYCRPLMEKEPGMKVILAFDVLFFRLTNTCLGIDLVCCGS